MKTPDDIKKGLKVCGNSGYCQRGCPYFKTKFNITQCTAKLTRDALAYIQQLERERDAAVRDMYEAQGLLCLICKNHSPDPELKKYVCKEFGERYPEDGIIICGKFEWRGVKEDEHAQTD